MMELAYHFPDPTFYEFSKRISSAIYVDFLGELAYHPKERYNTSINESINQPINGYGF